MGDKKKVELEKVVNQVFDKHYSKERLLENPMLRYTLNNQIFKLIFNNLFSNISIDSFISTLFKLFNV